MEIEDLLRAEFGLPHYAFLEQVREAPGFDQRTADALAMGLWKSRGNDLHGFEIKRTRSDLVRELKNPAKAEAVSRFCDFWWLVVDREQVLKDLVVPEQWGIIVRRGNTLFRDTPAPRLFPEPMSRGFLARFLKAISDSSVPSSQVEARVRVAREKIEEGYRLRLEENEKLRNREKNLLEASIRAFEAKSGLKIDAYSGGDLGKAVAAARALGLVEYPHLVDNLIDQTSNSLQALQDLRTQMQICSEEVERVPRVPPPPGRSDDGPAEDFEIFHRTEG